MILKYQICRKELNKRKNYVIGLLQNRHWEDLLKPYSLYSFIKIYAQNTQQSLFSKYFKIIISKIRNAFRRFLCICSFGIIYKFGFISPIISGIFIRKYSSYGYQYIIFLVLSNTDPNKNERAYIFIFSVIN